MDTPLVDVESPPLVRVGETCERLVRFTREDIATFARVTGDTNPLHHDVQAAQRARHGEIIASGQQTTAQMIGLLASLQAGPGAAGAGAEAQGVFERVRAARGGESPAAPGRLAC